MSRPASPNNCPTRDPRSVPAVSITAPGGNVPSSNATRNLVFGSLDTPQALDVNMYHTWPRTHNPHPYMPYQMRMDGSLVNVQGYGALGTPPPPGLHRTPAVSPYQQGASPLSSQPDNHGGSVTLPAVIHDTGSGSNVSHSQQQTPRTIDAEQSKSKNSRKPNKSRTKCEPSAEVIDITSSECEDDGARYLPGDSTYRGRSASRIKTRDDGGPRTRKRVARERDESKVASGDAASSSSPTNEAVAEEPLSKPHEVLSRTGNVSKKKRGRQRVKSSAMVVSSSSDELSERGGPSPPYTQAKPYEALEPSPLNKKSSSHKRSRSLGNPGNNSSSEDTPSVPSLPPPPFSQPNDTVIGSKRKKKTRNSSNSDVEDDEMGESELASYLGEIVKKHKRSGMSAKEIKKRLDGFVSSSKRWRTTFLDLEAVEDNSSDTNSSMDLDEYDTEDSFIDDGELVPSSSKTKRGKPSRSKKGGSKPSQPLPADSEPRAQQGHTNTISANSEVDDLELPTPGLEFEDFAREHKEKVAQQVEDDCHMAEAIERNQTLHALRKQPSPKKGPAQASEGNDGDSDSSGDEYGIKYYRAQLQEAIRRSRANHEQQLIRDGIWPPVMAQVPSVQDLLRMYPSPATPGPSAPPSSSPSMSTPSGSGTPATVLQTPTPNRGDERIAQPRSGATTSQTPTQPPRTPSRNTRRRQAPVLPDTCQVTDPLLQDPMLKDDYDSLPKLAAGFFIPWSNIAGPGQARFSAWPDQCPDMDLDLALRAIRFVSSYPFINPSRACPTTVNVHEISGGSVSHSRRYHAYIDSAPAIFVSSIYSELSKLREHTEHGLPQNMLQGKFHTQEWDRFVAFLCMVFGKTELHANLARDSMHFVTRAMSKDNSSGAPNGGMFSKTRSPSTKRVGPNKIIADNFALDTNNDVPIYDARGVADFDFDVDLSNLPSKLPRWNKEVPRGSFAVVGYTAAIYLSNMGRWTISCNIHWVIIVGSPVGED